VGDLPAAEQWFEHSGKLGLAPNAFSYDALIRAAATRGDTAASERWLARAVEASIEPDVATFTSLIFAAARRGRVDMASRWLLRAKEAGIKPNRVTFLAMFQACASARPPDAAQAETLLAEMAEKVAEVHVACGHTSETDADTLKMLGNIEGNLEDWLLELDEFEETGFATQVKMLENAKEKQRRDEFRRQRKQQSDRKIEERLKASLIRSQAPIHKKVGKQIMFRSMPLFQAKRVVQEDDGVEEAIKDHELFGIWINKEGIPKDKPPELSVDQHGRHIGQTMRGP